MMSEVTSHRREYNASVKDRSTAPVEAKTEESSEQDQDATRSVQDLIAAALKMFASAEPKVQPVAIEAPAIQFAAAPNIEAAVQQVLDQLAAAPDTKTTDEESSTEAAVAETPDGVIMVEQDVQADAPMTTKGPVATTAVRDPAPLPENPNPSHVHLVLDEGGERVVVTVAVRGNEVNAMIRGGDEHTAAALARNAASLDHALRAGGLDLSSFSAESDHEQHAPREHAHQHDDEEELA